ncbi:olfactory receptor 14I1-like [Heterocephalus glaber]|uniref:Olfactory receptor 14I1-like n=1 Tax=Heterocephalus glaber TaxID=10181 RepID=A0AAX6QDI4_HETGA|nr:olfactory receptor 14I1-like [Heterocephalus glaber]
MDNLTVFTEFLLMDVTGSRELQVLQDLGSISVVVPRAIVNSMTGSKTISLTECAGQMFLYTLFAAVEFAFLAVMSYDRYVAICYPLHYGLIITPRLCSQAAAGSWASGLVYSGCVAFIFMSYIKIFSTVLEMHSMEARTKAISTCTPQLAILFLFLISGVVAVLGPIAKKPSLKNLLTAVFYSMVPPFMNPIIYCLRNREINAALQRMFNRFCVFSVKNFLSKTKISSTIGI